MTRQPYRTPSLRRLGNVADITRGTGTGPGPLSSGVSSSGQEPVKIYGDYSPNQVGSILNNREGGK